MNELPYKFPFKKLQLFRVTKTFVSQRSDDVFTKGIEVIYQDSITNHYDEIEICTFRIRNTDQILIWHAHQEIDLRDNWRNYFQRIEY